MMGTEEKTSPIQKKKFPEWAKLLVQNGVAVGLFFTLWFIIAPTREAQAQSSIDHVKIDDAIIALDKRVVVLETLLPGMNKTLDDIKDDVKYLRRRAGELQ